MATYRVAFDGKWQGKFDDREDAFDWAREVGETGRIAHVAAFRWSPMRWLVGPKMVAVFPEERAAEGRILWEARTLGSGVGGGAAGGPVPG
jgi:hypothetical protein